MSRLKDVSTTRRTVLLKIGYFLNARKYKKRPSSCQKVLRGAFEVEDVVTLWLDRLVGQVFVGSRC
jgi:hypothetical protein